MTTPPINAQDDRLAIPDATIERIRTLSDARAAAAKELAVRTVRARLGWIAVPKNAISDIERDRLVGVLKHVENAVLTDRARQREVLREVQDHLPPWAALGRALGPDNKSSRETRQHVA